VSESKFWYVELKYQLKDTFNHAFKNLRWIVCWNFDKAIEENSEFKSIEENDVRRLKKHKDNDGRVHYFLDNPAIATKIQIIPLMDHLKETLAIEFK
jgi:hypothetical protein